MEGENYKVQSNKQGVLYRTEKLNLKEVAFPEEQHFGDFRDLGDNFIVVLHCLFGKYLTKYKI